MARALLTSLAAPGLVYVLQSTITWGSPSSFVLRLVAFGVVSIVLLRRLADSIIRDRQAYQGGPYVIGLVVGLLTGGAIALKLSSATGALSIGLLVAWIEELVFRREMPAAIAAQIGGATPSAFQQAAAVILAQVSFATCHALAGSYGPPFISPMALARVYASGGALALIYASFGLPAAVTAHFAFNELEVLRARLVLSDRSAVAAACFVSLAVLFRSSLAQAARLAMTKPRAAR